MHSAPQWVPMNGQKALPGECTRKTATLASKSASGFTVLATTPFLPSMVSFPFPSFPLLFCSFHSSAHLNVTATQQWEPVRKCWSLTFQQVSCQTRFCPRGPNKVWQDRIHVQSHVIMCVRCPRCSGGLGGRQPSRSHLERAMRSTVGLKHTIFTVNPFKSHTFKNVTGWPLDSNFKPKQ